MSNTIQNPEIVDVRNIRTAGLGANITAVATAVVAARNKHNQDAVERVLDLLRRVAYAAKEI